MSRVISNIITEGLSGSIGDNKYTFRRCYDETYLVRKSTHDTSTLTDAQKAANARFKEAHRLALADMADPEKRAEWEAKAKASKKYKTARGMAFAYYYALLGEAEASESAEEAE